MDGLMELLRTLVGHLDQHVRREETGIFPALRGTGEFTEEVDELEGEHRDLDAALEGLDIHAPDFAQRVTDLLHALDLHVERENLGRVPGRDRDPRRRRMEHHRPGARRHPDVPRKELTWTRSRWTSSSTSCSTARDSRTQDVRRTTSSPDGSIRSARPSSRSWPDTASASTTAPVRRPSSCCAAGCASRPASDSCELAAGDFLPIPPERHSVGADEDAVLLLTVVKGSG